MTVPTRARPRARTVATAPPARGRRWRRHRPRTFYLFASPWLLGFVLLTLFPLGYALALSFTNYDGFSPRWGFVGLRNYETAFTDPDTWSSLLRTLVFVVVVVPATIAVGLFLAALVNQRVRLRGVFRAIFFLPVVVPPVASAFVFRMLFDRDSGAATWLLAFFDQGPVEWLVDEKALVVLLLMIMWRVGSSMVISLAGLQGVPRELGEAAAIDGAGPWKTFTRVTLPVMSPVLFFQLVIGVIETFQIYLPALLLASAGQASLNASPGEGLYFYMVHVYSEAFANGNLGYASALLWLLTAVTVGYTAVMFRATRKLVYYESGPGGREEAP
ncbi:sugar ABC transporter permease [Streptomyces sp. SBST2-5]|uniref:Sugar ABC transporter permease n=1 Tax=Streptomyces composti TaxID=2720025 RepID=A0ABX1A9Y9_9ACTN|nr:sugar ABC transporter permease [Streptomyces composti]